MGKVVGLTKELVDKRKKVVDKPKTTKGAEKKEPIKE